MFGSPDSQSGGTVSILESAFICSGLIKPAILLGLANWYQLWLESMDPHLDSTLSWNNDVRANNGYNFILNLTKQQILIKRRLYFSLSMQYGRTKHDQHFNTSNIMDG